jgi:thiamine biosynthesis lipoprotein ApbE
VQAAAVLPSATETDALSTALLVMGLEGHETISNLRSGMRTLVVGSEERRYQIKARGIDIPNS